MARFPDAIWRPGPAHKVGYPSRGAKRIGKGIVIHSAEGPGDSMMAILDGPLTKSWCMSNMKSGVLLQHYEHDIITWHGGFDANILYFGMECEGMAWEPLTEAQIENCIDVLRWLHELEGWPCYARRQTLWEHNEFAATSCPSGRVPWAQFIEELTGDSSAVMAELVIRRATAGLHKSLADLQLQAVSNGLAVYLGVRPTV